MRNFPLVLLCLLLNARLPGQSCTFLSNMMLYSDYDLYQLRHVADSLQGMRAPEQKGRIYYHQSFGIGRYIHLDSMTKVARADLESGLSLAGFQARYPFASVEQNYLITSHRHPDFSGEVEQHLEIQPRGHETIFSIEPTANWQWFDHAFVLKKAEKWSSHYLEGVYLEKIVKASALPERYARMIRYTDALVDTNTTLFLTEQPFSIANDTLPRPARDTFFNYIQIPDEPQPHYLRTFRTAHIDIKSGYYFTGPAVHNYWLWQQRRDFWIEDSLSHTARFKPLLLAAVDEAIRLGVPDALLEHWAGEYLGWKTKLYLMRLRRVWSDCGNDARPTLHIYNMARLAASIGDWSLFIRAHLYLVNDYSDWSADSKSRFVAELEALGLDVPALLIGSALRIQDPAPNHFQGSIQRTGWALAECQNSDAVERLLRDAIADSALDDLNRLTLFQVYRAMYFRKHWPKENEDYEQTRAALLRELEPVAKRLPGYLAQALKVTDD